MGNNFYLSITANPAYAAAAPTLEVLVDGVVVTSALVSSSGTLNFLLDFSSAENFPASLSLRFNDGSAEGGRSITLQEILINGESISNTLLSQTVLLQSQVSSVNVGSIDHLFAHVTPVIADAGPVTDTGTAGSDHMSLYSGVDHVFNSAGGNDWVWARDGANAIFTGAGNDTVNGGSGNDMINGGDGANMLYGGAGDDYILAGAGADFMSGGAGSDVLAGFGGDDILLGDAGDDIVYGGDGADTVVGGAGNDALYGDLGDDMVSGGSGNDTVYGGDGNDVLTGDAGDDVVYGENGNDQIYGGSGNDTLYGDANDDVVWGGAGDDQVFGGTGNDILNGGSGNDVVHGDAGNDTIVGGSGADTLYGDDGDDILHGGGLDETQISAILKANPGVIYSQATNSFYKFVNTSVTFNAAVAAAQASMLNGVAGHMVTVTSAAENDLIYQIGVANGETNSTGVGANRIWMGGSDLAADGAWLFADGPEAGMQYSSGSASFNNFYVNWATSQPNGGAAQVYMTMWFNGGADDPRWDDRDATDTNDYVIEWDAGAMADDNAADTLYGGNGNDMLYGWGGDDILYGDANNDILFGGAGNDTLDGGSGDDFMAGGTGNDTYYVDSVNDGVFENAGEGTDLVNSSITYTLGANVENLTLTGAANIDGTGNASGNIIIGNGGSNVLTGGGGADTIDGGGGNDIIYGAAAPVIAASFGAGADGFTGADGGFGGSQGSGVTVDEVRTTADGNAANGALEVDITRTGTFTAASGGWSETINLSGAQSNVVLSLAYRHFHNTSNDSGEDSRVHVQIDGVYYDAGGGSGASESAYYLSQALGSGGQTDTGWVQVSLDLGMLSAGSHTITLGIYQTSGNGFNENSWVRFDDISLSSSETSANILAGGSGDDAIYGSAGDDIIDGGTGNDTMAGGDGNDTYYVDSAGDIVSESPGGGTDTVNASFSYTLGGNIENLTLTGSGNINGTGDGGSNAITGNSGNNVLDGGGGGDILAGGAGDDTYIVRSAGDVITELAGGGTDTVQSDATYTLGANLENLTLTGSSNIGGTGNDTANVITGNSGDNVLDGGAGADTLAGGLGNDIYYVDNPGDVVMESAGGGTDTVHATSTFSLASMANVENLVLDGGANIDGTGGSGANTITGNGGNNILDGGSGADTMAGGLGNDTYVVDNAGDVVIEYAGEGTDTVQSGVAYTLGADIENLTLTGSANINGTGNSGSNIITGNSGNNVLDGGGGGDTVYGGGGNDTITGHAGDVSLNGDDGNDTITSGSVTSASWIQPILGANPGVVYSAATGNFYEYVSTAVAPASAFTLAAAATLDGVGGHLATITSAAENAYVASIISSSAWIGGSDAAVEGQWIWAAGPEAGSLFWLGNYTGSAQNGFYTNWNGGEPNDYVNGEDYMEILPGSGLWNDNGPPNQPGYAEGYVIEWEGSSLMPSLGTTLNGGNGNDIITGGAGGDTLNGGAGNDTLTAVGTGLTTLSRADFTVDESGFSGADGGFGGSDGAGVTVDEAWTAADGHNGLGALEIDITRTGTFSAASGNWSDTVTLSSTATNVELDLSYRHFHDASNDTNENSRVHVMVDGVYYNAAGAGGASETGYYLSQALGSGGQTDTGWVQVSLDLGTLSAGSHTISLGIYQTSGNSNNENSWVRFDDVTLTGDAVSGNTTVLNGGDGLDTLIGGAGPDHFVFEAASAFNNVDVVRNFSTAQGDALDISDILSGTSYSPGVSAITNFVQITNSGADSIVKVDASGTGNFAGAAKQIATLSGVTGLTDEALLLANGNLITV